MRALVGLVIAMGILIVAGVVVLGVTIVHRSGSATPGLAPLHEVMLNEPAGTRIMSAASGEGRLTTLLQGGGADRVVIIDLASGRVVGKVTLAH